MKLILNVQQIDSLVEYFLDLAKGMAVASLIQQVYLEEAFFIEKMFRILLGALGSLLFLVITLRLREEDWNE